MPGTGSGVPRVTAAACPRIPCGEAPFPRIRGNGWWYVDKTRFLPPLEDERLAFFIRPRRFGNSCRLPHTRRVGHTAAWPRLGGSAPAFDTRCGFSEHAGSACRRRSSER